MNNSTSCQITVTCREIFNQDQKEMKIEFPIQIEFCSNLKFWFPNRFWLHLICFLLLWSLLSIGNIFSGAPFFYYENSHKSLKWVFAILLNLILHYRSNHQFMPNHFQLWLNIYSEWSYRLQLLFDFWANWLTLISCTFESFVHISTIHTK